MGLLDQLWDETVAGPRPDHGLGRLRKYSSFRAEATSSTPMVDGWRAFRRKSKMTNIDVVRTEAAVGPRNPTVYDWVVISSLE